MLSFVSSLQQRQQRASQPRSELRSTALLLVAPAALLVAGASISYLTSQQWVWRRRPCRRAVAVATCDNPEAAFVAGRQLGKRRGDDASRESDVLDGVEMGVGAVEADAAVECDVAMMDGSGRFGVLAAARWVRKPASLARKVLEHSGCGLLVGEAATEFAKLQGDAIEERAPETTGGKVESLEEHCREWQDPPQECEEPGSIDNHGSDGVGVVVCDSRKGRVACGFSTTALSLERPKTAGDGPFIGSGLYADDNVGACVAVGDADKIMKTYLAFTVVQFMRGGHEPMEACNMAVRRAVDELNSLTIEISVVAISSEGVVGAATTVGGHNLSKKDVKPYFPYAVLYEDEDEPAVESVWWRCH